MSQRDDDVVWIEGRERGAAVGDHPRAAAYARLGREIGALPDFAGGSGWRAAVLDELGYGDEADQVARARARRWRRMSVAVVGGALLAAGLVLWWKPVPPRSTRVASSLGTQIERGDQRRAQSDGAASGAPGGAASGVGAAAPISSAAIGDTLRFEATVAGAGGLWIYRGDRLVLRCPGAAGCSERAIAGGRVVTAAVRADAAIGYVGYLVEGDGLVPTGALAVDLERFAPQITHTTRIDVH